MYFNFSKIYEYFFDRWLWTQKLPGSSWHQVWCHYDSSVSPLSARFTTFDFGPVIPVIEDFMIAWNTNSENTASQTKTLKHQCLLLLYWKKSWHISSDRSFNHEKSTFGPNQHCLTQVESECFYRLCIQDWSKCEYAQWVCDINTESKRWRTCSPQARLDQINTKSRTERLLFYLQGSCK